MAKEVPSGLSLSQWTETKQNRGNVGKKDMVSQGVKAKIFAFSLVFSASFAFNISPTLIGLSILTTLTVSNASSAFGLFSSFSAASPSMMLTFSVSSVGFFCPICSLDESSAVFSLAAARLARQYQYFPVFFF